MRAALFRIGPQTVSGFVADLRDLNQRYVVELIIDGVAAQVARAQEYSAAAAAEGIGDACYGFSFAISALARESSNSVEVRIANTGVAVGQPIPLAEPHSSSTLSAGIGRVRWLGGLRFFGWIRPIGEKAPRVTAIIDGTAVAEVYARNWHHVTVDFESSDAVPGFDLHLPVRFADGRVRSVRIVGESGEDIPGSPVSFVAFEDGLQAVIASLGEIDTEKLRGELFDRLMPMSMPFLDYQRWKERFPSPAPSESRDTWPVGVVLVGDDDMDESLESLERQADADWIATVLPLPGDEDGFDLDLLDEFMEGEAAGCRAFVFALSGLRLESGAICRMVAALQEHPAASLVYGDLAISGDNGRTWPIAWSAFDYERMLEQGYCAFLFAASRSSVEQALARGASNLFRVFNAIAADPVSARDSVLHLSGCLGTLPEFDRDEAARRLASATFEHLDDREIDAEVSVSEGDLLPAVRVSRMISQPTTSIIIPTRNRVSLLRRCLETIAPAADRANAEIIVVDNDSSEPEALEFLSSIDGRVARVIRVPGAFNFSRLNNQAVQEARGDNICLLNNDIEALDDEWLDEMLSRLVEPDVAAVGAMLLWPSGIVQHGGVVLGASLGAAHAFNDRMSEDPGYGDLLRVAHECTAVTAACLLTRKSDYESVGGLDEIWFPVNFNDVDYCLKLRASGKRVVFTPHACLLHLESASRGNDRNPDRAARFDRELRTLRARWLEALLSDPYYNPTLALDPIPFSALAWPPRDMSPRLCESASPVDIPLGL